MTTVNRLPTVFMIVIPDNPISMYYRGRVEQSWTDRGFNIEYFNAVTPETIPQQKKQLKFSLKHHSKPERVREFSETEKAVWYSHFGVWDIARRKQSPIIIIEHDVRLIRPINPNIFKNVKAMGLCHFHLRDGSLGTTAGGAYFLNKEVASDLYKETLSLNITYNTDNLIHKKIDQYGSNWKTHYCEQINEPSIGTTIIHG